MKYRSYRAGGSSRIPIPKTVGRKRKYTDNLPGSKKKRSNVGRIFEGPKGGQFTARNTRTGPPDQALENCNWLKKKKRKK